MRSQPFQATPETIVRRQPDILAADVGDEAVLLSWTSGQYYALNPMASDIWRRIEQPVPVKGLCAALATDYDADPAIIERDLITLLEQLAARDLLADGSAGA